MKILGIDPGSIRTGWAVLQEAASGRPLRVLGAGTLVPPKTELAGRLTFLCREIAAVRAHYAPDVAVMEESFYQKNARTALVLGHARGALIAGVCAEGLPFAEYPPSVIKKTVGGSGHASKESLAHLLMAQLGLTEPLDSLDASDALAAAWTHLQMLRSPLTAATAGQHHSRARAQRGFDVDAYLERLRRM